MADQTDRHRTDERAAVTSEVAARLRARRIRVDDSESSDQIADLMSAVERFERAVERAGGDLMVDTPPAREPDNPDFVLPLRGDAESVADYIARLGHATAHVEHRTR